MGNLLPARLSLLKSGAYILQAASTAAAKVQSRSIQPSRINPVAAGFNDCR